MSKVIAKVLTSAENDIAVSAASLWEITIKRGLGRLEIDLDELVSTIAADGFSELPMRFVHARKLEVLPRHHDDPFDRILIAQSIVEGRRLVTTDQAILDYVGLAGFDPFSG